MLELNKQDETEVSLEHTILKVQKLIDKLHGSLTNEKHQIFRKVLLTNYRGLTYNALLH